MSEPCSRSRPLRREEKSFVCDLIAYARLDVNVDDPELRLYPGHERLIILGKEECSKKKVLSGQYQDKADDKEVFVDLLFDGATKSFEIWLWKPIAGESLIELPVLKDVQWLGQNVAK